jgi:hypothetical protein
MYVQGQLKFIETVNEITISNPTLLLSEILQLEK